MPIPLSPSSLFVIAVVVALAGAVNGIAGFGFAVVATMTLATVIDPATAVVFVIAPIVAVNLSLAAELSTADLRSCGRRFAPLLVATTIGTVLGMTVIDRLPDAPLRLVLGVVTLAFVVTSQRLVPIPDRSTVVSSSVTDGPGAMAAVGVVSGLLFGATNVGVQVVAYVRRFDLSHGLFVGVIAIVFLGVNSVRVAAAGVLGLYPNWTVAAVSVAAALPAVVGVAVGSRLRSRTSERVRRGVVLWLLFGVGVRLVLGGVGAV